ncbi:MAG: hypothetical protein M3P39_11685 [Actinomycetota bacterium]|jgi:hypothetical protein|nr:hypothetical protein [Actinomycetota bacterium]
MGELDALRIREEVLQALYWMRSEGLGDGCTAKELGRFLVVPGTVLAGYLERFADEGYLERTERGFKLSALGEQAGKRSFADEFADVTRPTHGECDEDCWCHESPDEAARCLEERVGHAH